MDEHPNGNSGDGLTSAAPEERIDPPFPWATDRHARVRSLEELRRLNISKVKGSHVCKECSYRKETEYEIEELFEKVVTFVKLNVAEIQNDRSPKEWLKPSGPTCPICRRPMKPEAAGTIEKTNWLFLLLEQAIGHLDLRLLKYFCKHNGIHRTGAKDRLLCSTYLKLCTQVDPGFKVGPS
ncbi:hypothetical protein HPP92_019508 [Vanilla planifolia]|uniref:DUF7086 domain-containing protein n=1 Tax=Vanilla planifolia TaxID=51239 RepID=A0A835Q5I4_VANPL|nr:hypothetical protein HPP92_019508 [Vanilla planifolia]